MTGERPRKNTSICTFLEQAVLAHVSCFVHVLIVLVVVVLGRHFDRPSTGLAGALARLLPLPGCITSRPLNSVSLSILPSCEL